MRRKKKIVTTPFDRNKIPPKQNLLAMMLFWPYCWFTTKKAKLKINKVGMKKLKPPYLVLCNHHSFMDFCITPLTIFPHRANYISELEGFECYGEWKYRQIGCLGTRKFVNDIALIKNMKKVIDRKGIMVYYPEARYANVGTSSKIPEAVGKLAKMLKVPVVVLNMKGNYLQSPIWNTTIRKEAKLEATITQIFTKEELAETSIDGVNRKIQEYLTYDEYKWQYETKQKITYEKRAEGIECALYQCPVCSSKFQMETENADIFCKRCGSRWHMTQYGEMERRDGHLSKVVDNTIDFSHIPNWYEWQRKQVIKEIEEGNYFQHDINGFSLEFKDYGENEINTLKFSPITMYSVHTEYNYRGKGQCITLSTLDNTYFLYPLEEGFNATRIQFATEYLYEKAKNSIYT
ncbi:hypothetical protein NNC19_09135 [Clostridium sp. SHJSY1]|uniref:hypothetical protein n=1 Tax=Clostridium sp. SHJSY1 TaxID=2942483 RepID=UPI0028761A02|nr:hypothetical protein [Clostridium sp. SHJSY1]MDS0525839.1 hypothetical protein [Clostridium sp. SHJSY1]